MSSEDTVAAVDRTQTYEYRGDRWTDLALRGVRCYAVRTGGKCVRGKNGNMLVETETGVRIIVLARQLRKLRSRPTEVADTPERPHISARSE